MHDECACERGVCGLIDQGVGTRVIRRGGPDELGFDCGEESGLNGRVFAE